MRLLATLLLSAIALMILSFLAAESLGWLNSQTVTAWLQSAATSRGGRVAVAGAVIALLAADLILPIPASVVMTLSGATLGLIGGTTASFAGAMASALTGFALCRRYGRRAFTRLVGAQEAARVAETGARFGAWTVLLSRGIPMLAELASCVAGLGAMPARTFALLAAAGTLPVCAVYAWAGHRGLQSGFGLALLLAMLLPALGLAAARLAGVAPRPRRADADAPAEPPAT